MSYDGHNSFDVSAGRFIEAGIEGAKRFKCERCGIEYQTMGSEPWPVCGDCADLIIREYMIRKTEVDADLLNPDKPGGL